MTTSREISVLVFAALRQRAGADVLRVEVPSLDAKPLTVGALLVHIGARYPELAPSLPHVRVAVNHAFSTSADDVIDSDAEIALVPPVSGGSPLRHDGQWSFLGEAPIRLDDVLNAVEHDDAGGVVTFTGRVRRHSRGAEIECLDYEAYAPMALAKMDEIVADLRARDPLLRAAIGHRIGRLVVGEVAVVIAVSTPHRAEAFAACREIIERLKAEVPIWKREVGTSSETWIGQGP